MAQRFSAAVSLAFSSAALAVEVTNSHLYSAACGASSTQTESGFLARAVVITTTLTRTSSVPRIVRGPTLSPPRKCPIATATTGLT
jgi:hypothetical protein